MSKRRGHNEGSIYKRKDGRWTAVVDYGYVNGKRKRKSLYGDTQKDVQHKLGLAKTAQREGLPIEDDRITVGKWLTSWLAAQMPVVRPKTYTAYENQIRLHIGPNLGNVTLKKLQPNDVREFMGKKTEEGLSPKTVRHLRATLRAGLNAALRDGMVARNVASLTKPPALGKRELSIFNKDQALQFLACVSGHRLEALFTVALSLGMRQGEILGLSWEDVDLEAKQLTIRHAQQRVKGIDGQGRLTLVEPKTQRSSRVLALPQIAVSGLAAHMRRQDLERSIAGDRWQETGIVFSTSVGTMLDQRSLLRTFYGIMRTSTLPKIRFHDLRHSAATLLLAQGVHPRFVMDLLGHSTISLTMNTYSHVLDDMKRDTASKMDDALNPLAVNLAVKRSRKQAN